ncbi:hypothetical protein AeMF1_018909 [Aphanomyces euteiches]|nr:hypothetical protein AeMF1_018909 [Aphanomyces euteiches]KAH9188005.1 hypothetical protein AeNC1_010020 [Aphanomyces euteiches]
MSHMKSSHPKFLTAYADTLQNSKAVLSNFDFVSTKAGSLYGWNDLIVNRNLPFTIVEDEKFRKYTELEWTCKKTLQKTMRSLEILVEKKIADVLPKRFGLIMDGWSSHGTAYCAIFASFVDDSGSLLCPLLAFSPLPDEADFSADQHIQFIIDTLDVFKKSLDNIVCISGDTCSVNQAIARRIGVPLIGCSSHKFNLAVKAYIQDHEELLKKVNNVMVKCKTLRNRGMLRKKTHLAPVTRNVTRWSSELAMINRFIDIEPHLYNLIGVADCMPSRSELRTLVQLQTKLVDLDSVMKTLQSETLTMAVARCLFDGVISNFPTMAAYLAYDAEIVQNPLFESAVVKVLRNSTGELSDDEAEILIGFGVARIVENSDVSVVDTNVSFADQILLDAEQKKNQSGQLSVQDLRFVLPTSNIVERLFSKAKLVLTDQRLSLLPVNFEMVLFLAANQRFWDVQLVQQASALKVD